MQARDVLNGDVGVAAHALVESYSVLTRLPAPFRAPAAVVVSFLQQRFSGREIQLAPEAVVAVLAMCAEHGIGGGAVYDALIAATVRHANGVLVTLDQRAVRTYRALGCAVDFLERR